MRQAPLIAMVLLAVEAGAGTACSIPVYRFALEQWPPASFQVLVVHDRPLDEAQRRCLQQLSEATGSNIVAVDVDLSNAATGKWQKIRERLPQGEQLPLLALVSPEAGGQSSPIWFAPLTSDSVQALLDSPVRRWIANKLGLGDTAVLVLLKCGDQRLDEAAMKLVQREAQRLEQVTTLPEPSPVGPQLRSRLPLRVAFRVLCLSREDAGEQVLLRMLLTSEPGLETERGPILFPIYGRGRLLAAIRGDDLGPDELSRVAEFLCHSCSCQVKELNPGMDLLFTANWEGFVDGTAAPEAVPADAVQSASEEPIAEPGAPGAEVPGPIDPGLDAGPRTGGAAVLLAVNLACALFVLRKLAWPVRRTRQDRPGDANRI
jgi:hypothetical protein